MATRLARIDPTPALPLCAAALIALDAYAAEAKAAVAARIAPGGRVDVGLLNREQRMAHGLAWLEVYRQGLHQLERWARGLDAKGELGETETLILELGMAEYLQRIEGGIPLAQGEFARPVDLGLSRGRAMALVVAAEDLVARGDPARRARLVELLGNGFGHWGLDDDSLLMVREQFRRFVEAEVRPHAHGWHLRDELIPLPLMQALAELGVFGLTVPEEHGGLGMSKEAMCVVTEELSRGYIGVGSLGTRSEIAAELIRLGGTEEQRRRWLPAIASGEIIPTAVFTEPDTGSDLAALKTRASRDGEVWRVTGAKTWITHAARADLMTMLVRTRPDLPGYKGLSILLAAKPRGTDADPFPVQGLTGSEIEVLGYRGMKEYALQFDGFAVPAENLLGGIEGQGFKQLMETFESARVQTAARAVGVAVDALELALTYAQDRHQFGQPLTAFPRVHDKLAMGAVEIMIARQLTLFAAREKDAGRRCDLEAGLAKLLAAQVAWSTADNALQIHGGNGYATEYAISRVLCDSRILNIFEGAAEIQAQVIARRLLEG